MLTLPQMAFSASWTTMPVKKAEDAQKVGKKQSRLSKGIFHVIQSHDEHIKLGEEGEGDVQSDDGYLPT